VNGEGGAGRWRAETERHGNRAVGPGRGGVGLVDLGVDGVDVDPGTRYGRSRGVGEGGHQIRVVGLGPLDGGGQVERAAEPGMGEGIGLDRPGSVDDRGFLATEACQLVRCEHVDVETSGRVGGVAQVVHGQHDGSRLDRVVTDAVDAHRPRQRRGGVGIDVGERRREVGEGRIGGGQSVIDAPRRTQGSEVVAAVPARPAQHGGAEPDPRGHPSLGR